MKSNKLFAANAVELVNTLMKLFLTMFTVFT